MIRDAASAEAIGGQNPDPAISSAGGTGRVQAANLLTVEGLGAALDGALPGSAHVVGIDILPLGEAQGHASRVDRIHVTYDPPGAGPSSVIVKRSLDVPAAEAGYGQPFARAASVHEIFAVDAPPVRTARCYHAEVADDGYRGALVLEDLGAWEAVDGRAGLTDQWMALGLRTCARLHAWGWNIARPRLARLPAADYPTDSAFAAHWTEIRPYLATSEPALAAAGDAFVAALPTVLTWARERPHTLVHGDYYADNLRFLGDEVAVLDWGLAFTGFGAYDAARLACTSSAGLPTAEYLLWACAVWAGELRTHGVEDYDDATAFADFRVGAALAFPSLLAALVQDPDPDRAATAAGRSQRVAASLAALGIDSIATVLPV